jgi:PAS domain S-box-containing protein
MIPDPLHSLLKRQLKKFFPEGEAPTELEPFISAVNQAYIESDADRNMLERSLEISSQELFELNTRLRVEQELLKKIFSAIPHHVFWKNRDSVYLGCNEHFAKVAGLKSAAEIVGKTDYDLAWKKEEADFFRKIDREVMEKGEPIFDIEEPQLQADGRQAVILTSKVPLRDALGNVTGILGVYADITEKKKIESRLLQSQKMETVGTLAGGIAHDLNNQLTPMRGYIDLVLTQLNPGDPMYGLLQESNRAAIRCSDIVQRLVNFSRRSSREKSLLALKDTFDEVGQFLKKFIPSTIAIDISIEPGLYSVMGNETELQTVFMNLAANARDAMPSGGRIMIHAKNSKDQVLITFKDSGVGIPKDVLPRIFEPFFTTKAKGVGTGLGLPMVFNIVKDHGGWIDVASDPGKGTTFQIGLPASASEAPTRKETQKSPVLPSGNETILLADDEESIRTLAKLFLQRLGYKVILACDGEESLKLYSDHKDEIAAVVLDMTMPKLTGRQTFESIFRINPKAKIILASGYTIEGSPEEFIRQGVRAFIQKPFTIQPFAETLRGVLDTA